MIPNLPARIRWSRRQKSVKDSAGVEVGIEYERLLSMARPNSYTLWIIILILVILWLGGFSLHIGGGLIHILIVIALILLIYRLATGRRVL